MTTYINAMEKMNKNLIEYFNVSFVNSFSGMVAKDPVVVNKLAVKVGYIVHPDCCNEYTYEFLKDKDIDYNSTFYKLWSDVTSKSREELLIDQIVHYATTYGTNFSYGNGYVPNDGVKEEIPYEKYKVIMPCTCDEMAEKCANMLYSGVALKENTLNDIFQYVSWYLKNTDDTGFVFDVDKIANKEAQVRFCDVMNVIPNDKFNLLRYIVYKMTGNTLVIKSKDMISVIKKNSYIFDFRNLNKNQIDGLSSIFLRFKDLFLAMRSSENNRAIINKIRRLAVKNHKPLVKGFAESIFEKKYTNEEIKNEVAKLSNFKIVTLMQLVRERILEGNNEHKKMYIIRNGKIFIKDYTNNNYMGSVSYMMNLYDILEDQLVKNLKKKKCIVKFQKEFNIACPTSEKNFVGNYPFGTNFDLKGHNTIGVYWKNEWGTNDFDIHMFDENNNHIGWNSNFYNDDDSVVFSGDMTYADPEACEMIHCKGNMPNGVVYLNRYNGLEGSTYKLFFGQGDVDKEKFFSRNGVMIDPNDIKLETMCTSNKREQMISFINNKKVFLMCFDTANNRVANRNISGKDMYNMFTLKAQSFIMLNDILVKAGFVDIDTINQDENTEKVEPAIDFTNIGKDTLINLFA